MPTSREQYNDASDMEGFKPEVLGDFETGSKGGVIEQDPLTNETIEDAKAESEKGAILESLKKNGLESLAAHFEGLPASKVTEIDQALNMVGAGVERLMWINPSPESQAKAEGFIQEILLAQDVAAKRNAARGLYELTDE
jgi:hypothetical protein